MNNLKYNIFNFILNKIKGYKNNKIYAKAALILPPKIFKIQVPKKFRTIYHQSSILVSYIEKIMKLRKIVKWF